MTSLLNTTPAPSLPSHPSLPALVQLNAMASGDFVDALGAIFEHAPWVAEAVVQQRPFSSVEAMHRSMLMAIRACPREKVLKFLCGHPELSAQAVRSGTLTNDSQQEQESANLGGLSGDQAERLAQLNRHYRERHGFPFIACVRHYTRTGLFAELASRTERDTDVEFAEALRQIGFISWLRLTQRMEVRREF